MLEPVSLISGFIIIIIVFFDFFYTTLSGSGASFITQFFSFLAHRLQLFLNKRLGRKIFTLSGMLVNLIVLAVWVVLIWAGLFLVYSSDPDAILNSEKQMASASERLYFTGYVLSTLGIGDFYPVTPFFEILTSIFSFFGFIFFTTSMTYLVSVFSAVMHKRSLALAIRNLGKNPSEVIKNLIDQDSSFTFQQIADLQKMIGRHSINHEAYPVIHYYNNPDSESALSINITILDESVSILLRDTKSNYFNKELRVLRNSIDHFLEHVKEKYNQITHPELIPEINWYSLDLPDGILIKNVKEDRQLTERRKILTGLLMTEGFTWQDVYSEETLLEDKQ